MSRPEQACCVRNCGKSRLDNVVLHMFPNPVTQPDRFRSWVLAIGGGLWGIDDLMIHKSRKICHNHFEPRFHTRSKRLSADAVPTLYLSGSLPRQPLREVTSQAHPVEQAPHVNQHDESTSKGAAVIFGVTGKPGMSTKTAPLKGIGKKRINNLKNCPPEVVALGIKIKKLQQAKDPAMTRLKKDLKLSENITFQQAIKNFIKKEMESLFLVQ